MAKKKVSKHYRQNGEGLSKGYQTNVALYTAHSPQGAGGWLRLEFTSPNGEHIWSFTPIWALEGEVGQWHYKCPAHAPWGSCLFCFVRYRNSELLIMLLSFRQQQAQHGILGCTSRQTFQHWLSPICNLSSTDQP